MSVAIVWFRRDLRLTDHPALAQALADGHRVLPVYVHAPQEDDGWAPGAASRWWLHHSLDALGSDLATRGARLVLRRGGSAAALLDVAAATKASAVYWNRLYEPAATARDAAVRAALEARGVSVTSTPGHLLFEPGTVLTRGGEPYRVFKPFWKACTGMLDRLPTPMAAADRIPGPDRRVDGESLDALALLPRIAWDSGLEESWRPGERGGVDRLEHLEGVLGDYGRDRDRPDVEGTSRLSPHLHFGELSPLQVLTAARLAADGAAGSAAFVRELGWREFAHHLLFHFPRTTDEPLDARFGRLDWRRDDDELRAWQRGRTGFPIVDAGMRELWHTGWMHNRVRMIVASLLTKNLFMPWREGARWFWDTLVDADLANNSLGWQWTAGCGADAAPYFRVFSPVLQAEKFDPGRRYIRRWVPELARLPDKWIHCPWAAPAAVLAEAGVRLGRDYPLPVVDPKGSRDEALRRFAALKERS